MAYTGSSGYGYLSTFTIDADGDPITEVTNIQFNGNSSMEYPSLLQMNETYYLLAYYGYDSGTDYNGTAITNQWGHWIGVFQVSIDGSSITKLNTLRHDTYNQNGGWADLVKVDDDTYALAYRGRNYGPSGGSSYGGWIKTFTVNGSSITQAAQLRHWTSWSYYHSWAQADANTFVVAWMDNHSDGRVTTFTIPADGSSITEVAELEHDTDLGQYPSIIKLDSDTYVVAQQSTGSTGEMFTFTIPDDGSAITKVTELQHSDSHGFWNSMMAIDANTVLLTYSGTVSYTHLTLPTICSV